MMLPDIKSWLIAFVVVSPVAVWDASTRLSSGLDESVAKRSNEAFTLKPRLIVTEQELSETLALFSSYDRKEEVVAVEPVKVTPKKVGLSQQEQEQQKGKLNRFYVGDLRFVLKGIFTDNDRFAVLYRENLTNGQIDEVRVTQDQLIGPYKVTAITENKVYFALEDRVIELAIF